jgi:hypothetical protein
LIGYTLAVAAPKYQAPRKQREIICEVFEAHDGIDVAERVLFPRIQSQIACNRYSFGNYLSESFPVPSFPEFAYA